MTNIHLEGTKVVFSFIDNDLMGLIINDKRKVKWNPEDIVFKNMK